MLSPLFIYVGGYGPLLCAITTAAYLKRVQGAEQKWDKTEKTGKVAAPSDPPGPPHPGFERRDPVRRSAMSGAWLVKALLAIALVAAILLAGRQAPLLSSSPGESTESVVTPRLDQRRQVGQGSESR